MLRAKLTFTRMRPNYRTNATTLVALALVAVVGMGLVEGYLPHTDDGCKVEIHCLACRWAMASTAVSAPLSTPSLALELAGTIEGQTRGVPLEPSADRLSSRGPPRTDLPTI